MSSSMPYVVLGASGLRVSRLCLGTMTFGEDWGWGAPLDTCRRILAQYADAGGNFVDTAINYTNGSAEAIVGELLSGQRDRFVLSTKFTLQTDPQDVNSAGNHRKNLVRSLETSLRKLKTDHIDIYWVHARDVLTPIEELMRALDDQVRAGKVLSVGVSDTSAWEIAQANTIARLRGWSPFVAAQMQYNLIERTPERDLLPMAGSFGLGVLAWGPLASGLLTGKYLRDGQQHESGRLSRWGIDRDARTEQIVRAVVAVAEEVGKEPSQVALAWLLTRPGPVIPILGATREAQLEQNLGCLDVELSDEQLARLEEASAIELGFPHDFLRSEGNLRLVYGEQYELVEGLPRP